LKLLLECGKARTEYKKIGPAIAGKKKVILVAETLKAEMKLAGKKREDLLSELQRLKRH